ncbi:MAG: ImmA/IrrE family metallo-endopeptidase [bacterium]|nr:ImmA/IrrE family metallo-endopeptidase [bacterium]
MARATFAAERAAKELLQAHNCGIPVDVKQLAKDLGCIVVEHDFENDNDVSGLLIREADKTIIAVNQANAEVRKRFTIAHEIGHLVMHPGRPLLVDASVRINARTPTAGFATEREETEANQFAAALLMPTEEVRDRLKAAHGLSDSAIAKMARKFGVSDSAMQFRLVNLGFHIPH